MIPTLRMLQPNVFRDVMSADLDPAPMADPVVITSDKGQVKLSRFLGSGTWTKTSNNSFVVVFAWNGGCGGGSQQGAGGAPGNSMCLMLPSYYFGASTAITVGAGGAGGAAVPNASNGLPGSVGGSTSVGSITIPQTGTGGGGFGSGTGGNPSTGGTGGGCSYVMSGGYYISSSQQTGGDGSRSFYGTLAYIPNSTTIGSGTVRMPCLPFMVSTGGGGSITPDQIHTYASSGGDINVFGIPITMGGAGSVYTPPNSSFDAMVGQSGTYLSYSYGGLANNGQAMMFVTGGTGGGGAGGGGSSLLGTPSQQGGSGGIGAGGGGGSGVEPGGSAPPSGAGGNGGPGLVLIYEFI